MSITHIALACAIGAGLGFHISWQISPEFWWIGALLGGAGAFLFAAAPQLPSAIRRGWQRTIDDLPLERVRWRYTVSALISTTFGALTMMAVVNLFMWMYLPENIVGFADFVTTLRTFGWFWLSALAGTWLVAWVFVRLIPDTSDDRDRSRWELAWRTGRCDITQWCRNIEGMQDELLREFSAVIVLFVATLLAPLVLATIVVVCLFLAVKMVPHGWRFIVRLGRNIFHFIHAAQPLLCFVDAGLAVVIAHLFLPSSLWGDVAAMGLGGALGVIHFELVSVRWLKLANQPADK